MYVRTVHKRSGTGQPASSTDDDSLLDIVMDGRDDAGLRAGLEISGGLEDSNSLACEY